MIRLSGLEKLRNSAFGQSCFDVAHEVEHQRQRAQREEQPAGTAVLAQRVADAVLLRHLEIEPPQPVAVDRGGIDDEAGAVERGAAVGGVLDQQPGAGLGVEERGELGRLAERCRRRGRPASASSRSVPASHQIAQHAEAERRTGGAEEDDLGRVGHWRASIGGRVCRASMGVFQIRRSASGCGHGGLLP